MSEPAQRRVWLAWAAVAATILIWASFLLVTRAAVTDRLGPVEVGLLRFLTATVVLAPVLLRHGVLPAPAEPRHILRVALLGGFGFVLLLAAGMQYAPVADSVVFAPSMLPFYVALLSFLILNERFSRQRMLGFALILTGAVGIGGWEVIASSGDGTWRGHLFFTVASFVWAVFTLNYRASGLPALQGAAMMCFWSALAFLLLVPFTEVRLLEIESSTLFFHIIMQGVVSGVISTITYAYALQHLPASKVAACGALVPPIAAAGGWFFLAEPFGLIKAIGIAVVTVGVLFASGVLDRTKTSG
ncbi:MAG: DMT family transporter [Pseudomonadota bacterium]